MRIGFGADQLGVAHKDALLEHVRAGGHEVVDMGVHDTHVDPTRPVDYPDVAADVARAVASGAIDRAVLVCGTGLGMAIAANKVPGVRAGAVTDPYSAERLAKSNDAQVICIGARVVGVEVAKLLVDHFLESEFAGGESTRKVAKLAALDTPAGPAGPASRSPPSIGIDSRPPRTASGV